MRRRGDAAARGPGPLDRRAAGLLLHYYRPRAARLVRYALTAALQALLVLPVIVLIRMVFDVAIPQGHAAWLPLLGGAIVLIRLVQSGLGLWLRSLVLDTVQGAVRELRQDLMDRLYGLSREYLNHADLDRMHTRIVLDSERFDHLSTRLLSGMLPALFASLALLAVVLFLNWRLVALAGAVLPVLAFASRRAGARVKSDVQRCQQAMEQFSQGARFTLQQLDLIRLQSCERQERGRLRTAIRELSDSSRRMAMSFAVHGQVQRNLSGLAGILILVAGGTAVAHGGMSLGDLMSFYVAAGLLNGQFDQLAAGLPDLVAGQAAVVKLHGLLNDGEAQPYRGRATIAFTGDLRFEGVSFAYDGHQVLCGIDLHLAPGEHVAIVGANGAGKTTLLDLAVGFCRPRQGVVRADGRPYDSLDLGALRAQFGVVRQQPGFFAGTVLDNLRFGRPQASLEAVRAAARLALADDFVMGLERGYEAAIGEGGVLLSGGERQRLAIARALLGAPRLLILDEPTNHLDSEGVGRLMASLARAPGRPALLVVSHDPGVVAGADRVYRLAHGRLSPLPDAPPGIRSSAPSRVT